MKTKWIKIGTLGKSLSNMYGKEGSKQVIYIDNWSRGNYSVILGEEISKKSENEQSYHDLESSYKEKSILQNVGTRKEALKIIKQYIKQHQ